MYPRLFKPPGVGSYFLFGPRGTGKSTWVRAAYPDAICLDLLDAGIANPLLAHPERLREWIPPGFAGPVIVDEVQKAPALLDEVHRLIERAGCTFVLTGSSARKLRRGGVNLLGGRALTTAMHPLTVAELGADFDLARSLRCGHLPLAVRSDDPSRFLAAYIQTYLREEVAQEGLTRNLEGFARFLEAAAFSHGSVLNISSVAQDAAVDRKVVEGYFGILTDLLLGFELPVFRRRAKRRMTVHPKFWFFDAGVYRALRPAGPLDSPEEIDGAALETLVLQEMRALNDYLGLGYDLYFWRSSRGQEVDFVLYGERGLIAMEVKRAARVRPADLVGLRAFRQDYPMSRVLLLYGGHRRQYLDGLEVIPVEEALREMRSLLDSPGGGPTPLPAPSAPP